MSNLSKFKRLRARSKRAKKNSMIIFLEITFRKIKNQTQTSGEKTSVKNAQSPQTYGQLAQKSAETVRPTKNSPPGNHANSPHFTYHKERKSVNRFATQIK